MKKKLALSIFLLFIASNATSFEASLVRDDGTKEDLSFDKESNYSNFFSDFPVGFEKPESLGSFSFRDHSIVNPNLYLNLSGNGSLLSNERIQLYYASRNKKESTPILSKDIKLGNFTENTLVDIDFSSFKAVYPGKVYVGLTSKYTINNSNISGNPPYNLTEVDSTFLDGNFSVIPSVQSVKENTKLKVEEVFNSNGEKIHESENLNSKIIIEIRRENKTLSTGKLSLKEQGKFNFTFIGGEKVYVNGILTLKTKAISKCDTITDNDFYYLINQSIFNSNSSSNNSCLTVANTTEAVIDFSNSTIDGSSNQSFDSKSCAVNVMNSSEITIKNPRVQEFSRGICILDSSQIFISGTSSKNNNLGIYLQNSSANISKIELKNEESEIKSVNNSKANLTDVKFATANVSGFTEDTSIKNVFKPPPDPENLVNISQWINITATDKSGYIEDLGFHYSPLSQTNVNPLYIYKFDINDSDAENSSIKWKVKNMSVIKNPSDRIISVSETVDEFSVFSVYGEEIKGNGTGNNPGRGAGNKQNGTGSQGGGPGAGSGAASGGAGGGLRPEPEPEPTPIKLNLSLKEDNIEIQQGGTRKISFSVQNIGEVDAPNTYVKGDVRAGWTSGRKTFENIPVGETVDGEILMEVYSSEVVGNYSIPVKAYSSTGSTLDTETLNVEVLPRKETRDIKIIEGPTFLTLPAKDTTEVGFLLRNSGDYKLENLSINTSNMESCIKATEGSHSFEKGEKKNVEYKLKTKSGGKTCTGVVVFNSKEADSLSISPIRVKIEEASLIKKLTTNVLPALFVVWTIFTIYWIRRELL